MGHQFTGDQPPSLIHVADLIPDGWTVAIIDGIPQDVNPSQFDITKLKLKPYLKGSESRINSNQLRQRAIEMKCNLGLCDGKRMLADGGKLIPVKFRTFFIPLPGTVLRCSDRRLYYISLSGYDCSLYIPYLDFCDNRWCVGFYQLESGWYDRGRLASFEQISISP